jgi:ubiquinone/menaquinone biosynthesis C-methylase UbiE
VVEVPPVPTQAIMRVGGITLRSRPPSPGRPADIQAGYYARTANEYDRRHVVGATEHEFALAVLLGAVDYLDARSLLDVGSGTGRVLQYFARKKPDLRIVGVEPIPALRAVAYEKGISRETLLDGEATNLRFPADSFDVVCAFGVLHHIAIPSCAVAEMLRLAKMAVFISDANNFGQGNAAARLVKQVLRATGLWPLANRLKTRGKGYTVSEGDGLAYSYSVFDSYDQIRRGCAAVHIINTKPASPNLFRSAPHVALLGVKEREPQGRS